MVRFAGQASEAWKGALEITYSLSLSNITTHTCRPPLRVCLKSCSLPLNANPIQSRWISIRTLEHVLSLKQTHYN